jgi:hypothetical protein
MYARFHIYAPLMLLVVPAMVGCGRISASPTDPAAPTALQGSITAEPVSARPQFLHSPACFASPAFSFVLRITVGGGPSLELHGFRFLFIDRLGARTFPEVTPIPTPSAFSLPSSSPVSVPGFVRVPAASAGTGLFPLLVKFGCDVVPEGTLIVTAETGGASQKLELRIQVGGSTTG